MYNVPNFLFSFEILELRVGSSNKDLASIPRYFNKSLIKADFYIGMLAADRHVAQYLALIVKRHRTSSTSRIGKARPEVFSKSPKSRDADLRIHPAVLRIKHDQVFKAVLDQVYVNHCWLRIGDLSAKAYKAWLWPYLKLTRPRKGTFALTKRLFCLYLSGSGLLATEMATAISSLLRKKYKRHYGPGRTQTLIKIFHQFLGPCGRRI